MTLIVTDLSLYFGDRCIFEQVDFCLEVGQIACLLGHSGCGKTSILRCLSGFETPKTGSITLGGRTLFDHSTYIPAHQRHIGMVFQDYALFPHLTVAQNIAFGIGALSKTDQAKRVAELLELIDLQGLEKRYPHELSGGQQQRVALARCLAPRPSLVLLDEPFSNLDVDLRANLSAQVRALLKSQNVSAILVTHDQTEGFIMADVVGVMAESRLQQWDVPQTLYDNPATQMVAKFIGGGALLDYQVQDEALMTAFGRVPYASVKPLTRQSSGKVLVRPENVTLMPDGEYLIRDKKFCGSHWLYTLTSGADHHETLIAQTGTHIIYQPNQRVGVTIQQGWVV